MSSFVIRNDAVILGLLAATLGVVFWTTRSPRPFWQRLYKYVPALVLCYFLPALYNTFGLIDGEQSKLYFIASRYLLPATLVLLTLAIDLPATLRLGPKALIMFFTASLAVVLGGPLALLLWKSLAPNAVDPELWRGMTAIAGSWIGGAANQAAMKEVFQIDANVFGVMVAVDVLFSYIWMAVLLWMAAQHQRLDRRLNADTRAIAELGERMERMRLEHERIPALSDLMIMLALAFGATGLSHALATPLAGAFAGVAWAFAEGFSRPSGNDLQWVGDALGVAAAVLWGATTLVIRATRLSSASAEKTLLYQLAVSGALLALGAMLAGESWPGRLSAASLGPLAFQTVVVCFASYLLWFWLIRHYPATPLASFTLLTPISGLLAGVLLLSEPITLRLVVALAAVTGGIAIVNKR